MLLRLLLTVSICWWLVAAAPQQPDPLPRIGGKQRNAGKCKTTANDPEGDCLIGEARVDYPELLQIPETSFNCDDQKYPGMYADLEADCQVFHLCPLKPKLLKSSDPRFRPMSFLCSPGLVFNQRHRVCDWWFNVQCERSPEYFADNRFYYKTFSSASPQNLLNKVN